MKKTLLSLIIIIILLPPTLALAADYTLLAPLPGLTTVPNTNPLGTYIPFIFNLLIGLATVAAVLMIVFGGFQYMTTDAIQGKSAGRERIKNAIFGLVLVISAWLILYTINPKLLELNLNIDSVTIRETESSGGTLSTSDYNCTTCTAVGSSIAVKNGSNSNLAASIMSSVTALDSGLDAQGVGWSITEGYPPTVTHQDSCHYDGTCFDAVLTNPTTENIKRFVETARNNGLSPSYEVANVAAQTSLIQSLTAAGLSNPPVVVNTKATGVHFHVEN
jgi:hypothetical protein